MSQKLFRTTAIYGLGNICQKGLSFFLVFLYTHFLSASDIGVINSVQVFSAIYVLFLSFGLERSLYRLYHDYKDEARRKIFLGTINISIIVISIIVVGLTIIFRNYTTVFFEEITFYPFLLLGVADAFFTVLIIVPKLLFQVEEKPVGFILLTLGESLFGAICICVMLFLGHRSATWVLTAGILSYAIFLPISVVIAIKNMTFKFDWKIFNSTIKYSLPLVPSLLSSWVINMSDRVFLAHFYSMKDVGLYSVVYKIGQVVQLFATASLMAYTPLFYAMANTQEPDEQEIIALHNKNIKFLFFSCFFIALISNDFIRITLTKEYLSVAYVVPIIVFGYFFIQMIGLQNLSFSQNRRTVALMIISVTAAFTNIIFNYCLIKPYGISGAAIATFLTQFVFFAITYIWSLKFYFLKIHIKEYIPVALISIIVLFVAFKYLEPGWLGLGLKCAVIGLIVFILYRHWLINKVSTLIAAVATRKKI